MAVFKVRDENENEVEVRMSMADMLPPVKIDIKKTVTMNSDVSNTGVSFTIPANSLVCVEVGASYSTDEVLAIGVSTSSTTNTGEAGSAVFRTGMTQGPDYHSVSSCPMSRYVTEETTYYVWAKSETNGATNPVYVRGFYITVPETVADMSGAVGELSNLATTDKSTLVNAVNELAKCYIVESGTTDGWRWEKWSDGTTKAKTTTGLQKGIACTTAYGGLFHSDIKTITVPASLISAVTDVIPRIITTNGIVYIVTCGVVDNVISYYVVNGSSSAKVNTNIMFEVEGVSAN